MPSRSAVLFLTLALRLPAQTPAGAPKPELDVVIFKTGERLVGHLLRAHGSVVTFKSEALGEVNLAWGAIQELHSSQTFAVLDKGIELNRRSNTGKVPQGKISMADQKLTVTPASGPPQTIPVADAAHLIDVPSFENIVLHNPGFFDGWKGALAAGASLVEATQASRTLTTSVNFVRAIPTENWMAPRDRTIFDFSSAYGLITEPNTSTIKTNIIHTDLERDEYFAASNVFAFGRAAFDHNYSQGLDLQQSYGGGIGWTVIKRPNTTLDLKASVSYTRQNFTVPSSDHNLIGSVFSENYAHKFARGIQFLQGITMIPAWNEAHAWAAAANASLNVPVYKRLGVTVAISDYFLNDPPPGFKKNSFQFTTGLSYNLR